MHGKRSGSVPRKTIINDQPHMLAYINPEEAMMLKSMGGAGKPGPGGIPAFYYGGDFGEAGRGGGEGFGFGGDQSPAGPGLGGPPGVSQGPANVSQADIDAQNAQNAARAAAVQEQQFEDDLSSMQQKIDTPVEQTGILGTLSKFSPLSMAGRALNKAQMQSAYNQLAGKSTPNQGFFASIGKSLCKTCRK